MELQSKILKQYLALNEKVTLKVMSEETGIQMTRCFRLMNGSSMKLSEYEAFKKIIITKLGLQTSLEEMVLECSMSLSDESMLELEDYIRRKLKLIKLKKSFSNQTEQVIA